MTIIIDLLGGPSLLTTIASIYPAKHSLLDHKDVLDDEIASKSGVHDDVVEAAIYDADQSSCHLTPHPPLLNLFRRETMAQSPRRAASTTRCRTFAH